MRKRLYAYAGVFLLGACIGGASTYIFETKQVSQITDIGFYSKVLLEAKINEKVEVNGVSYRIESGSVYQGSILVHGAAITKPLLLAYEKVVARRNPLIALAGTDPIKLTAAIKKLQQTQKDLAGIQTSSEKSNIVAKALYPTDFLTAAGNLETARQKFLASGSDKDADTYQHESIAAAKAYQYDLEKFKRGFILSVPKTAPPYLTLTYSINYDRFLTIIENLQQGMDTTQKKLAARSMCFSGVSNACMASDLQATVVEVPIMKPISAAEVDIGKQRMSLPPFTEKLASSSASDKTLLALADPKCTEGIPGFSFFLVNNYSENGLVYKMPLLLGNKRLIEAATEPQVPFFTFFLNHSVSYVPSTPFVYYECLKYPEDASRLLFMDLARNTASSAPLSVTLVKKSALQTLETKLTSTTQPITEQDAADYASLGASNAGAFDLALAFTNGSAFYDSQLLYISDLESTNVLLSKNGVPVGLDAPYLFYTRNGFFTFFMTNNPSVSGEHESLFGTTTVPDNAPYLYYDSLTAAEQRQADKDLDFYYQLHANPISIVGSR